MKRPKDRGGGPLPGECMACNTMALAGSEGGGHHGHHGHSMKRSTWSAMTVSQAREVYPSRAANYEKALVPVESKMKERTFHYLQVRVHLLIYTNVCDCVDQINQVLYQLMSLAKKAILQGARV